MSNITVTVAGGRSNDTLNVSTVGDLKETLSLPNHVATVSGDVQEDSYSFTDGDSVFLSQPVKGGHKA